MNCGSGFPAANRFDAGSADRGWEAAPTIKPTTKILKLTHMRRAGSSTIPYDQVASCGFKSSSSSSS
jgi:hypothetical protein